MITTGDIVRVGFPFLDDESKSKERYGLVISKEGYHTLFRKRRYLIVFVSTAIPRKMHPDWEFLIEEGTDVFENSGLQKTSIVKAHRIKIVQEDSDTLKSVVGKVPVHFVEKVRQCLTLF